MYENEKIIHNRSMRDYLVKHGGVLLKTKIDLCDRSREIYIFKKDSIADIIGNYKKGEQKDGN